MQRLIYLSILVTLAAGCGSELQQHDPAVTALTEAEKVEQQVNTAIVDAEAAIAQTQELVQLTAGIDSRVPGQPRLSDTEIYRRTALSARAKAHQYASLANMCSFLGANVDDEQEKDYWRRYAISLAAKSDGLRQLAARYARMSRDSS
jgi:hypothetical protein